MPSIASILSSFLVLVLSLSFHEAAHAWMADRLGDPTARLLGRLTLNPLSHIDWIGTVLFPLVAMVSGAPLIGWAKPVPVSWRNLRAPRRDYAVVALAGPASNLLLATGAAILFAAFGGRARAELQDGFALTGLLADAVALNVLLAVFNMIPVPPLDGGNVLAGVLPESGARAIDALRPYGFLIIYGLMLTHVLSAIAWPIESAILRWLLP